MLTKNQLWDKVIFLGVMLSGMGFLVLEKGVVGTDQTIGIAVTIGGLIGLISAHSLQAVFTLLEKGFLNSSSLQTMLQNQVQQGKSL